MMIYIVIRFSRRKDVVHYSILGPDDGWNWPEDEDFRPNADLRREKD